MKRTIIKIDEDKCNGCGLCVPACHEGAIQIIDGKAKLVGDALCDGLGACLGECPEGAILIEERDAEAYDEIAALENIMAGGPEALAAHLKHLEEHGEIKYLEQAKDYLAKKGGVVEKDPSKDKPMACGCPGSMTRDFRAQAPKEADLQDAPSAGALRSALQQWPVQLRLLNPRAPFFKGAELVVSADCVPFSYADFHRRFLKDKVLVVFCPKLDDDLDGYIDKLADVFRENEIRSVTTCRMEVPCCIGTERIVEEAISRSGKNVIMKPYTISLRGEII